MSDQDHISGSWVGYGAALWALIFAAFHIVWATGWYIGLDGEPASTAFAKRLHRWDVEHHHGRIGDPSIKPYGNGVLLWFELDDFDAAVARAEEMKAEVIKPRHRSENAHWECWLRDPEGYTIVLASPHGSAGGLGV